MSNKSRTNELALIHIAKKQLGLDDKAYRDMLWVYARVRSAADLDEYGRKSIIKHMKACGATFTKKKRIKPAADKKELVGKIRAFLAEAKRPDEYGDAMAKRMFKVERYEWLKIDQLSRMIAALSYDAKRHNRRTE